jgi:hypothetical protein
MQRTFYERPPILHRYCIGACSFDIPLLYGMRCTDGQGRASHCVLHFTRAAQYLWNAHACTGCSHHTHPRIRADLSDTRAHFTCAQMARVVRVIVCGGSAAALGDDCTVGPVPDANGGGGGGSRGSGGGRLTAEQQRATTAPMREADAELAQASHPPC